MLCYRCQPGGSGDGVHHHEESGGRQYQEQEQTGLTNANPSAYLYLLNDTLSGMFTLEILVLKPQQKTDLVSGIDLGLYQTVFLSI